ncbi:MAG: P1 family peptidase [Parvularculaceae bacterium]|nr:P1 family peptidase [Parvularculaceae bacterium]
MSATGPGNAILDTCGLRAGNSCDENARTGVTVILPDAPAVVAGDVRGGGPGARETDLLDPSTLVERADAFSAWPFEIDAEFGGARPPLPPARLARRGGPAGRHQARRRGRPRHRPQRL